MSALHPAIQGAVAKAERGIAMLKVPSPAAEHLRSAMDHFKSAFKLASSHHTMLVELEDELPAPGAPLFDATGAPAPGAVITGEAGSCFRPEDHFALAVNSEGYKKTPYQDRGQLEDDLLFAVRLHLRSRGLDEKFPGIRKVILEDLGGIDSDNWDWLCGQVLASGDFEWPYHCEDCQEVNTPDANGVVLCWSCSRKREDAKKKTEKAAAKKTDKAKAKPTPKAPSNPLATDDGDE